MTSTYSDMDWEHRAPVLGDPAENACVMWAERHGYPIVRYGLNRPPISLRNVPAFIRYTPDFLGPDYLMEVQGCGRDQLFKFKHEKLWALTEWDRHMPVNLFLWNQTLDAYLVVRLNKIRQYCSTFDEYKTDGLFDGTKPYATVRWELLLSGGVEGVDW